jgi:hypothetical protein
LEHISLTSKGHLSRSKILHSIVGVHLSRKATWFLWGFGLMMHWWMIHPWLATRLLDVNCN